MTMALNLPAASQATSIEQARVIAEVLAAIEAANRSPRDEDQAVLRMHKACASRALAERAFYAVARGEGTASGESIHLARELARCWTHVNYGTKELNRDDVRGVSEIQAYAVDLETLVRVDSTFIVPHRKSLKGGQTKVITDLGQIYENNANAGARRVRECILNLLPYGFVARAAELCQVTLAAMSPQERENRISALLDDFERNNIDRAMLEGKAGRGVAQWSAADVVDLEVLYQSLRRREISRDEAFPAAAVTADQITALGADSQVDELSVAKAAVLASAKAAMSDGSADAELWPDTATPPDAAKPKPAPPKGKP